MDEYPDEDVSFGNLHYGLDTSLEENAGGVEKPDRSETRCANLGVAQKGNVGAENQMNVLQDMVLEMKEGFQTALEELMKIQVKEEAEASFSKKLQEQQQEQLTHLAETVGEIKNQLSFLARSVEEIKAEQKMLKDGLEEVRSNSQKHRLPSDRFNGPDDFSSHSEEWRLPDPPTESDDHNVPSRNGESQNEGATTTAACKSLILTRDLAEVCRAFNLSQSSGEEEDDDDSQGIMRVSNYRQNHGHLDSVQRQKAVTQLVDSEKDYCSQLWSLCYTYLTSLQTAAVLSTRELDILIPPYLDQLYREHCSFCTKLQDRLMDWTLVSPVADLLFRVADSYNSDSFLSLYQKYANDLPIALNLLRRALTQSSEFRIFLKQIQHSSCHSQDLMSLLLSPILRMPNYLLQVQEISRQTPPSHTDFPRLQTLLIQLKSFVDQLNDVLLYTMADLNHDAHTGSDFLNGHFISARDSGVHSVSTEDDYHVSARSFHKTNSQMPLEGIESPYHSVHQRQTWASSGKISSLSHPDLTTYNKLNSMTSDPSMFIPRSQSNLHAADDSGNGGNQSAARQRVQKFKIKLRSPSPARYQRKTQDHDHSNVPPRIRPVSSIDFLRHHSHHQQQNHQQHDDLLEQSRSYQHPGPQPRSHSAFGLHTVSSSHRPVVISRKNIKRPQSSVSTSSDPFWNDSISSSTLPPHLDRQRGHLMAKNVPPKTSPATNVLNGSHDAEDDTRASDTNSFAIRGSHSYNNEQDLIDGCQLELNLAQSHVDVSQSPENIVSDCDSAHSSEFVSQNGSQTFYNDQLADTRNYSMPIRQVISRVPKTAKLKEQLFIPSTNEVNDSKLSMFVNSGIKENQSRSLSSQNSGIKENQPRSLSSQNSGIKENQPRSLSSQNSGIKENQPRSLSSQNKAIQPLRITNNQMKVNQQSQNTAYQIEENQSSRPLINQDPTEEKQQSSNQIYENQPSRLLTNHVKDNQLSRHSTNQMKDNINIPEQPLTLNSSKDNNKSVNDSSLDSKQELKKGLAVLPSRNSFLRENTVPPVSSVEQDLLQESNEISKNVQENIELARERSERNNVRGRDERRSVAQERDKSSLVQERNETSRLVQRKCEMSRIVQRGNATFRPAQGRNGESSMVQGRNEESSMVQGRNEESSMVQGRNESSNLVQRKNEESSLAQEIKESLGQEKNESSLNGERNESKFVNERGDSNILVKTAQDSEKIVHNMDSCTKGERPAQVENNRQFLMSLTSRTSLSDSQNAESHLPPRSGKVKNSPVSQTTPIVPLGKTNTKPALPPKRHLQTPASPSPSSTNAAKTSLDNASPFSDLKYDPRLNQNMPSSNQMYQRPPSALSNEASNLTDPAYNHQASVKLHPQSTSSSARNSDVTIHTSKMSSTLGKTEFENGYNDPALNNSEPGLRPLSMADLQSDEEKSERRKEITQKEIKDGGNVANTNSVQPSEDPAGIKKKSHFRASLKHLFAKKKFTESDV